VKFFAAHVQRLSGGRENPAGTSRSAARFVLRTAARLCYTRATTKEATDVDLALRLNVLAVCAVFLFVGAVLLGAF